MAVNQGKPSYRSETSSHRNENGNQNFSNGNSGQKPVFYPQKSNFPSQRSGINQQRFKGKKNKYNPTVTCTYCFKTGHIMDDCHGLHGYPEDFVFTKGKSSLFKGTTAFARENIHIQEQNEGPVREGGSTSYQSFKEGGIILQHGLLTQEHQNTCVLMLLPSPL